ncbi:MAG: biotin/lipoyl-binding protein [Methylomicrobium sp.]|nr:biotin/lipoyl-binding protein [Methylomicrobium sp.]
MSESMFSSSWYRIAGLQPRLKGHVQIHRHHYRGQLWYVLQDFSSSLNHRFSPQAHYIISLMNGRRHFQEIWEIALEQLGDDAPTQDEMVKLLGQLHSSDLLLCDVPPDTLDLFQRYEKKQRGKWLQKLKSPLSIRFPLWDPDKFLDRWLFLFRPLFGWFGALLWLSTVITALILAGAHWVDLSMNVSDRVWEPGNLVLLFFVYPVVKLLHELGHAFAAKVWGGEVHEMGVMLLVFMPIPYVDASSSWGFRDKKKRAVVGAAGMAVELFLAALALFVWLNVEPGMVRAIAYNVMLIGGVSTLFFNGNPLLRFDGYYIFADLIEIPNLGSRASNYIGYLFQHYVFGLKTLTSPVSAKGERFWFLIYGSVSFCYRMLITFSITFFVASQFFLIGIILALWAVGTMILVPLGKSLRFIFNNPMIQQNRVRVIASSAALVITVSGFLLLFPMPLNTYAQGIVWLPEQAKVRAGAEGFVVQLKVRSNTVVQAGDVLVEMDDPLLKLKKNILHYQREELQSKLNEFRVEDRVKAQIIEEQIKSIDAEMADLTERIDRLTVKSESHGVFIVPNAEDLKDRFLHKGDLVGYVVNYPITTVRAVVTQDNIGLVRAHTGKVEMRLAGNIRQLSSAAILREIPAASDVLPSAALGLTGGGTIPVKPTDEKGEKAFEPVFHIELAFPPGTEVKNIGERVYIRFDHGLEPLALQWYRLGRQLFLRTFSV